MATNEYQAFGAWNFVCDQCGRQYKSFQANKQWDGLIVCARCWEPRNPQDFIKAIPERPIPWSRPSTNPCPPPVITARFVNDPFAINQTWIG